ALAADGPRVPELFRDLLDRGHDVLLLPGLGIDLLEIPQQGRREHGARPRAEILGREVFSGERLEVLVDVRRSDVDDPSAVVAVLKELLARQVAALPDDSGKASIVELQFVRHAALPAEDEPHLRSRHLHVPVPHRRQAVRVVVARVLFVADANERLLEQPDDRGEDFRARKARSPQVGVGTTTNPGKRAAEVDEAAVLARVADLAPLRVIAVLLAAARVAAGRLEMTARLGTDPDVLPRRR